MAKDLNSLKEKYKVDEDGMHLALQQYVTFETGDKVPSKHPIAIIVGGQSGAGKTALMNKYSTIVDGAQIDNDAIRPLHPRVDEIKTMHPEYYTELTDQISLGLTPHIISYLSGDNPEGVKHNLVIHQTMKNTNIANYAMKELKDKGYIVGVAVLAVSYAESKMSQIERCLAQYNTFGSCRHVPPQSHMDAIKGLPSTIGYIENNELADFIYIHTRNNDNIADPILQYAHINPERADEVVPILRQTPGLCCETKENGFENAQDAVETLRHMDTIKCMKTLDKRIDAVIIDDGYEVPGMAPHLDEIRSFSSEYKEAAQAGTPAPTCPTQE